MVCAKENQQKFTAAVDTLRQVCTMRISFEGQAASVTRLSKVTV